MDERVLSTRHREHGAQTSNDTMDREVQQLELVVFGHCQLTHSLGREALDFGHHCVKCSKGSGKWRGKAFCVKGYEE